ncbi:MAG: ribosome-binding factor A [Chloroflexi bacterium HGW-Chloroflexi-1]|nr:MAG: ribosome-binding factor A [Chloroflexi bacterium HGW-Chloroflexi-1]
MPGGSRRRQQRVSELLHEELSILISTALTDPRLADAMINVTAVIVSPDLRNARVYIEHVLPAEASRQIVETLVRAQGFLRQALVENLNLRYVPELTFQVDRTSARGHRIDEILDSLATSAPGEPHERDTDIDAAD